ncbi:glycosyltransferase [Erysipelothrix urinaevulpis]|uniref:glycosyltransferase n=1 Tax=Erysipelothrix urinaevulpis TaxID=2683717 RepID=UPI001356ABA0|nr:glycosyltransferase [Erysipelothrix urinaevulpis]
MKVLLFQKGEKMLRKSGIGRAMRHQMQALDLAGVEYTTNPDDDYDIVHINTVDPYARKMAKKANKKRIPVVYHAHSTEEDFKNSFVLSNQIAPVFKRWIMSSYKLGDYILTPTPYSKEILEGYGIQKPIQAISNGIDLNRFSKSDEKVKKYREFFNLSDDDRVILSVGLYFERKGLPDFIELAQRMPEYTFIWFGFSPLASVTKKVRDAIKEKPDNLIMPGYISGDIIEGAYADADIFLFPSYEETEGIVVLEALAGKCQVMLRDIPVYDPWMVDQVNCYKANNNDEFERLVKAYLEDEIPNTIAKGYEVARERSIEAIGYQLKEVYERNLRRKI